MQMYEKFKKAVSLLMCLSVAAASMSLTAFAEPDAEPQAEQTEQAEQAEESVTHVPGEETAGEEEPEEEPLEPEAGEEIPEDLPEPEDEVWMIQGENWETEPISLPNVWDREEFTQLFSTGDGIQLKEGRYVRWIDRIQVEPFGLDFYEWLRDNSDNQGQDDLIDMTSQEHILTTRTANIEFTYQSGQNMDETKANAQAAAQEAVQQLLNEEAQYASSCIAAVYGAFMRDTPEVFWLNGKSRYGFGIQTSSFPIQSKPAGQTLTSHMDVELSTKFIMQDTRPQKEFDVRANEYQNASAIRQRIGERDSYTAAILSGAAGSREDKLRYLNQWLTGHNGYNTDRNLMEISIDCRRSIGALEGNSGVLGPICEGYASAMKVLCDEAGIPCVLVDGYAKDSPSSSGENHMWNYVQMEDGGWYAVDPTWNDPVVPGYENGAVSGHESEDWFLLGSQSPVRGGMTFLESHPVNNMVVVNGLAFVNGPALSDGRYEPSVPAGVMLRGVVASSGEEAVTVELWQNGVMIDNATADSAGAYSFANVAPGDYVLHYIKTNHVTRETAVTVENQDVTLPDTFIRIKGDISGDGKLKSNDAAMLFKNLGNISDSYEIKAYDISGDGKLKSNDAAMLFKSLGAM